VGNGRKGRGEGKKGGEERGRGERGGDALPTAIPGSAHVHVQTYLYKLDMNSLLQISIINCKSHNEADKQQKVISIHHTSNKHVIEVTAKTRI